ncbi:Acetyltransferase, GNAT family [Aphelenchoides fujianensis]|nr:Acetyltransferase, GNAT family [Aphelenchoides fujianensis]
MENIAILHNPERRYWEQIVAYVPRQEGWMNAVDDYALFLAAFPGAFHLLVAVDSTSREFVGIVSVATYAEPRPLSQIGMYVVRKERRGRGVGSAPWAEAMRVVAPRRFLYADEPMDVKYAERFGFDKSPGWTLRIAVAPLRAVRPRRLAHDAALAIRTPAECGRRPSSG